MHLFLKYPSLLPLILANFTPLYGVLFWEWKIPEIILLYWLENIIVGFYTVLKMLTVNDESKNQLAKFFLISFFFVHFGLFTFVHGVFVMVITTMFITTPSSFLEIITALLFPFLMLFLSHGVSFIMNFIYKDEKKTTNFDKLFLQPYGRIVIMHLTILLGMFIVLVFRQPIFMLILLVVLKTIVDVFAHISEHTKGKNEHLVPSAVTIETPLGITIVSPNTHINGKEIYQPSLFIRICIAVIAFIALGTMILTNLPFIFSSM